MAKDWITDENGKFKVKNGDFVIDESEEQEIEYILKAVPGDFKEFPLLGADMEGKLASPMRTDEIERDVRLNMSIDNKDVNGLRIFRDDNDDVIVEVE